MKNPFKNIDIKDNKVPMQKKVGNSIVKKTADRPEKTKMGAPQRWIKAHTASR